MILALYLIINLLLLVYLLYILFRLLPVVVYAQQPLPFIPISYRVAKAIATLPEIEGKHQILDLGCGTGSLVGVISRFQPQAKLVGIDLKPKLIWLARCRSRWWRNRPTWAVADMFTYSLTQYDVIVGWWVSDFARRLLPKFLAECRPGSVIVSYMFPLPVDPAFTHRTKTVGRDVIHIYQRRAV